MGDPSQICMSSLTYHLFLSTWVNHASFLTKCLTSTMEDVFLQERWHLVIWTGLLLLFSAKSSLSLVNLIMIGIFLLICSFPLIAVVRNLIITALSISDWLMARLPLLIFRVLGCSLIQFWQFGCISFCSLPVKSSIECLCLLFQL